MSVARLLWRKRSPGIAVTIGIAVACVIALLAIGAFVLLAPFSLRWLGSIGGMNWAKLSNVAQTYAAATAVLGTVAIGGVALSLIMQARESRANREQIRRTFHNDLILRSLDDPELLDCWGIADIELTPEQRRQFVFTNLIFSYWWMLYETGTLSDAALRENASQVFSGSPARRYWVDSTYSDPKYFDGKRAGKRFAAVLNDEYNKSASGQQLFHAANQPVGSPAESASEVIPRPEG
jgi:hypothetical protein